MLLNKPATFKNGLKCLPGHLFEKFPKILQEENLCNFGFRPSMTPPQNEPISAIFITRHTKYFSLKLKETITNL